MENVRFRGGTGSYQGGKAGAVILAVTPETLESTVRSIRRARFSDVVARMRSKVSALSEAEIEKEIMDYRANLP